MISLYRCHSATFTVSTGFKASSAASGFFVVFETASAVAWASEVCLTTETSKTLWWWGWGFLEYQQSEQADWLHTQKCWGTLDLLPWSSFRHLSLLPRGDKVEDQYTISPSICQPTTTLNSLIAESLFLTATTTMILLLFLMTRESCLLWFWNEIVTFKKQNTQA